MFSPMYRTCRNYIAYVIEESEKMGWLTDIWDGCVSSDCEEVE